MVFAGRLLPDEEYREMVVGPHVAVLLGGDTAGVDSSAVWESSVHPDDWDTYVSIHGDLQRQVPTSVEYRLIGLDGVTRWMLERTVPRTKDENGVVFDGIVVDITELRLRYDTMVAKLAQADEHAVALERARVAAEARARVDELTGLHNRRHFTELLFRQVLRCGLTGDPVAVLMLDIDHFKAINDAHGHMVGDAALAAAAARLRAAIRPTDVLARWGGEEFVVLLQAVHDTVTLHQRAEELRIAIRDAPLAAGTAIVDLRVSIGGTCRTVSRTDSAALLEDADRAMYEAKTRGRDQVVIDGFDPV